MAKDNVYQLQEEDETIDLLRLIGAIRKKVAWILMAALLGAILLGGSSRYFIKPTYTAKATLYIFDQSTNMTSLNDLQVGTQLASDFTILATSEPVVNKMIETLALDTTYEAAVKRISAENKANTRLIELTVKDHNAEKAKDIANALADALVERVTEIMVTSHAYVAVPASEPLRPSGPNVLKNTVLGALTGLVLAAGIVVISFLADDTIKDAEDVERYLGMVTLAEFPVAYETDGENGKRKKKQKRYRIKAKKQKSDQ